MLWVTPIFLLVIVSTTTWSSLKAAGKYSEVIGGSQSPTEEEASDSNHDGFAGRRTRNPITTSASPLCTAEQREKIAHQLMLIEDEREIETTDMSKLKSNWPKR